MKVPYTVDKEQNLSYRYSYSVEISENCSGNFSVENHTSPKYR